jgi:ribosome maturation protein SDO1
LSYGGPRRGTSKSQLGKEKFTVARYRRAGKNFEVLVDPEIALEYRLGRTKDLSHILVFDEIYTDHKKGLKASREDLMEAFGTADTQEVAERIMQQGEVLIKTDQKRGLIEEKKKQIASYISRHCVDTRTGAPVPLTRVERGMDEIEVNIDPFENVEDQVPDIIRKLAEVIPLRQQVTTIEIVIPAVHAGRAMGFVKESGEITNEEWQADGSYKARIVLPAGVKTSFMEKLGSLTRGTARMQIVEERGA